MGFDVQLIIAVIVPGFNEEETISTVIRRIPRNVGGGARVVIIVVDDGSTDSTAKIALQSAADIVRIHRVNAGVAQAFKTGLRCALEIGAQVIVNIDADNQFDPTEIANLVAPIMEGRSDLVLGSRFLGDHHLPIPVVKRAGNMVIALLVSILAGKRIRDTQCGFRALSSSAAHKLNLSGFFTYTQEMILDLSYKKLRIMEVPVSVKYFRERQSRVVKSIPQYTFKVLGLIAAVTLRNFSAPILVILAITIISSLLCCFG